jgi:hypothetical protein
LYAGGVIESKQDNNQDRYYNVGIFGNDFEGYYLEISPKTITTEYENMTYTEVGVKSIQFVKGQPKSIFKVGSNGIMSGYYEGLWYTIQEVTTNNKQVFNRLGSDYFDFDVRLSTDGNLTSSKSLVVKTDSLVLCRTSEKEHDFAQVRFIEI